MLSGSAIARVSALLLTAAVLAGLVQAYWPQAGGEPTREVERPPVAAPPADGRDRTAARQPDAAPPRPHPDAAAPSPVPSVRETNSDPGPAPARPPVRGPGEITTSAPETRAAANPAPPVFDPEPAPAEPAPRLDAPPGETATGTAEPPAGSAVDLNTGTLAELNGLEGGGNIGRAIIRRRPYASVDELLSKRVLSRSAYERIKDQVTVR